jgi:hypothetical protein
VRRAYRLDGGLLFESLLAAAVLASLGWAIHFLATRYYLPQPFIFDTFDTFMDWFNVAAFANQTGAYDVWHAVYPPISFVFLQVFSDHQCYGNSINARDCDWIGQATILTFYVADCVAIFVILKRAGIVAWLPRALCFSLGFPLLFCLERGNLILVCLIPFMLAYGDIVRSRFWRGLCIGLTINFKPYLLVAALGAAVKRDWRLVELGAIGTIVVYLASLAAFGSGDPFQIVENLGIWARLTGGQFFQQAYVTQSYAAFATLDDSGFPILDYLSSETVETAVWLARVLIASTQVVAVVAVAAAWLQPDAITLPRATALFAGVHLVTQSLPSYSLTFLIFLVFLERERRPAQTIALFCCYALSITYDVVLISVVNVDLLSWLTGVTVPVNFGLGFSQLIRPGLVIVIVWALAFDTLGRAIAAHKDHRPSLRLMPA